MRISAKLASMATGHTGMSVAGSSSTPSHADSVYIIVIGFFMLVVSLTQVINPRLLWRARAWTLRNPAASEPSAAGFIVMRVAGAIVFCVGLLIILRGLHAIG